MNTAKALFVAVALTAACDSADPETTTQPGDAAELELEADDGERRHHGKRHGKHGMRSGEHADRLCEKLDCTDEQHAQVKALFDDRDSPRRGERPDHGEANTALADAFRGETFTAADLRAFGDATRDGRRHKGKDADKLAELHAILTPEQRSAFADKVAERGMFGGHKGRGDKRGEAGEQHVQRRVERLCDPLACSDEQRKQIEAIVAQAMAIRPDGEHKDDARGVVADAMRADTFDAEAVKKHFDERQARHEERKEAKADTLVSIHGVLTSEQRGKVADRIEESGPSVLMGHGGKHGKRGKRGKHGKRGRG